MTAYRRAAILLLILAPAGCDSTPKPRAAGDRDPQVVLREIAGRAATVRTFAGRGRLTLDHPSAGRVTLDAALAARPPGLLRLRAWKLGQAVFDLTSTPDGVWLLAPEEVAARAAEGAGPAQLAQAWAMLTGDALGDAAVRVEDRRDGAFTAVRPLEEGLELRAIVDAPTATVRRYALRGADGGERFALDLEGYRVFDGVLWPTRLVASRGGETVTVRLDELTINGGLAPDAFDPPRRAVKQP